MERKKVEIGEKFGALTVIKKTEPYISPNSHKATQYLCRCDCGKERIVTSSNLTSSAVTSCGCNKKGILIGDTYGHLTIISKVEPYKSRGSRYLCRCDCGITKIIARSALLSGKTSDCGHIKKIRNPKRYKIGEKYGMLTIIGETSSGKSHDSRVICRCDCGYTKKVFVNHLKNGTTKSCGCLRRIQKSKET